MLVSESHGPSIHIPDEDFSTKRIKNVPVFLNNVSARLLALLPTSGENWTVDYQNKINESIKHQYFKKMK